MSWVSSMSVPSMSVAFLILRRAGLKGSDRAGDRDTCPGARDLLETIATRAHGGLERVLQRLSFGPGRFRRKACRPTTSSAGGTSAGYPQRDCTYPTFPGEPANGTWPVSLRNDARNMTSTLARSGSAGVVSTTVGLSRVGRRPQVEPRYVDASVPA
jgi:hypothetical protein